MAFARWQDVAKLTLLWIGAVPFIKEHVAEIVPIGGASMSPTVSPKWHETGRRDWMLWQAYRTTRDLKHGDLVMYHSPIDPETLVCKRIIATGGDVVTLDPKRQPGSCTLDGVAAAERWRSYGGKLTVPFGHVWLEGDNWRTSKDSNWYGPVSKSLIVGKGAMLVWPWNRSFTKPWEDYKSKTKVERAPEVLPLAWKDD